MSHVQTIAIIAPFIPQVYVADKLVLEILRQYPQTLIQIHTLPKHNEQFEHSPQISFSPDLTSIVADLVVYIGDGYFLNHKLLFKISTIACKQRIWVNAHFDNELLRNWLESKSIQKTITSTFDRLFFENKNDYQNLLSMGFKKHQLCLTASLKYDSAYPNKWQTEIAARWLAKRGLKDQKLVVFGSASYPEESQIFIETILKLVDSDLAFVIAPRSLEHVEPITYQLKKYGLKYLKLAGQCSDQAPVVLLDSIGLLKGIYQYASLVVLGRTFVSNNAGGSNMIEAAAAEVPIVVGPALSKDDSQMKQFCGIDGVVQLAPGDDLSELIKAMISDEDRIKKMVFNAKSHYISQLGEIKKLVTDIFLRQVI